MDNPARDSRASVPPESAIRLGQVHDLTKQMDGAGRLAWSVPAGKWTILRVGYTPTGKTNHPAPTPGLGLECDKMSREAAKAHWAGAMEPVLSEIGSLAGEGLKHVLIDSYEVGSENWTPLFRKEFMKRRGYDLLPYLPAMTGRIVENVDVTERFLWDVRRTIADLFAENYFGHFRTMCHRAGLELSVEPYGNGGFDDMTSGGHADIPMTEFWVGQGPDPSGGKLAGSIAHTYGRKVVGAESFTASADKGRWQNDPFSIKALGDMMYCGGVNRFIFHRYAHQPWVDRWPGMTMGPWGIHMERTITWWDQSPAWLRYLARCQFLLQEGRFVADVCYFNGEGSPNSLPGRNALTPVLPAGYDYDGCDPEILMTRMSVRDGKLVLRDGMSYSALVLPPNEAMMPTLLRKVAKLVRAGATVVGARPSRSPSLSDYPKCDDEVRTLADNVWGDCDGKTVTEHAFGKGRIVWGKTMEEILASCKLKPDFEFSGDPVCGMPTYIHRNAKDADVYFVANWQPRTAFFECTFRVSGKRPELWHPDTGRIEPAPVFAEREGRTTVPLRLDPCGSVFVVFRKAAGSEDHLVAARRNGEYFFGGTPQPASTLEIRKAVYGVVGNAPQTVDVTAKLTGLVKNGQVSVIANNELAGDPAPNVVKQLRVEYALNGAAETKVVGENELLVLPETEMLTEPVAEVALAGEKGLTLRAWEPGTYEFRTVSGKTVKVEAPPVAKPVEITGPWQIRFQPGRNAPEAATLDKLISWTEHADPGVRYFSGTATYRKEVEVAPELVGEGKAVYLDLGRVMNLAEVRVNGKDLGVLWKPPFRLEVTELLKAGRNTLEVSVTNLWPNRLIGDEQLPDDCEWNADGSLKAWPEWFAKGLPRPSAGRCTLTTWKHYTKDSPLLESGLIGPVELRVAMRREASW